MRRHLDFNCRPASKVKILELNVKWSCRSLSRTSVRPSLPFMNASISLSLPSSLSPSLFLSVFPSLPHSVCLCLCCSLCLVSVPLSLHFFIYLYITHTIHCIDYAGSQFRCHYLSSTCPLVWDNDPDPSKPSIAVSRIFCGQILNTAAPNTRTVFGFGASIYAMETSGDRCMYKGGIKDDPCFVVKGQRSVPVARGKPGGSFRSRGTV